jgi:hypothetical protein
MWTIQKRIWALCPVRQAGILPGTCRIGNQPRGMVHAHRRNPQPNRPIWNAFWSGGISNPLEVIEQITYLLFLRRLDDLHTLEENKSARLKKPMERRVFPEGKDPKGRPYDDLRWSRFKHFAPARCTPSSASTSSPSCARWAATTPPTRTT